MALKSVPNPPMGIGGLRAQGGRVGEQKGGGFSSTKHRAYLRHQCPYEQGEALSGFHSPAALSAMSFPRSCCRQGATPQACNRHASRHWLYDWHLGDQSHSGAGPTLSGNIAQAPGTSYLQASTTLDLHTIILWSLCLCGARMSCKHKDHHTVFSVVLSWPGSTDHAHCAECRTAQYTPRAMLACEEGTNLSLAWRYFLSAR